jgi:putative transposase
MLLSFLFCNKYNPIPQIPNTCLTILNRKNALNGSKPVSVFAPDYAVICFNYIHQNPVMAGIVSKMEDWEFSSFRDFAGFRNGSLVNKKLAFEYIDIDWEDFYNQSVFLMDESILRMLF